jgi:predicted nucleic acid-binding protein
VRKRLHNDVLAAPDLLLLETGNALWRRVRQGHLPHGLADDALKQLRSAPVPWFQAGDLAQESLSLATALDHPIYDCV